MFVTLTAKTGERICFNVNRIFFVCEQRKRGVLTSVVVTDDGTSYDVKETLDEVLTALSNKG